MKKNVLILLQLATLICAANTFESEFNIGDITQPISILETSSGYILSLVFQDAIGSSINNRVLLLDKNGNTTKEKDFDTDCLRSGFFNIHQLDDGNYACLGYFIKDEFSNIVIQLVILDNDLNIVKQKYVETKGTYEYVSTNSSFIDNEGKIVSAFLINKNFTESYFYFIMYDNEGNIENLSSLKFDGFRYVTDIIPIKKRVSSFFI